jgi:hypothetical protein
MSRGPTGHGGGQGENREGRVLLGPLDVEDEVVVSKARHPSDGARGILTTVEADEGKALGDGADKSGDKSKSEHG